MSDSDALIRFGACLERGDADGAANCFTSEAVYEEPPRFAFAGRPALRAFIADFLARHTDVSFTVERTLTSGDGSLVAAEWRWSYRRLDGSPRAFAGMCFVELRDGLIARWRGYSAWAPSLLVEERVGG
jgi:ketosteroid isomerase-like protein